MQAKHLRRAGAIAATVAVSATGVVSVGAASGKAGDHEATIKMVAQGKELLFKGPRKVEAGSELNIVSKTDPAQVGPHSFTLVKQENLPETKKQIKDCEHLKTELCAKIVADHKVDLETEEIHKPSIDVGKTGWDKSYGKRGDSWVAQEKGASESRKVKAKPGTTLYYFCVVHPFMQGKIKVVK